MLENLLSGSALYRVVSVVALAFSPVIYLANASRSATAFPPVDIAGLNGITITDFHCQSAGDCVAIGRAAPRNEAESEVVMNLRGTTWKLQRVPSTRLSRLSCVTQNHCMAVGWTRKTGQSGPLFDSYWFDGTRWSSFASPTGKELSSPWPSVTCVAERHCFVSGAITLNASIKVNGIWINGKTYVAELNGAKWSIATTGGVNVAGTTSMSTSINAIHCSGIKSSSCIWAGQSYVRDARKLWHSAATTGTIANLQAKAKFAPSATAQSLSVINDLDCMASEVCFGVGSIGTMQAVWRFQRGAWVLLSGPDVTGDLANIQCSLDSCIATHDGHSVSISTTSWQVASIPPEWIWAPNLPFGVDYGMYAEAHLISPLSNL